MRAKSRLRALRIAGQVVGAVATFALATAGGVILHLPTASARRIAASTVDRLLASSFQGTLTVEGVTRLELGGVAAKRVTVRDSSGTPVLTVHGVRADVDAIRLLRSLVKSGADIDVRITHARVDAVDLNVVMDPNGSPTLAHAFDPKTVSTKAPNPQAGGVIIDVRDARIATVHASGAVSPQLPLDVDVTGILGTFRSDSAATTIGVRHLTLAAHGLPSNVDPVLDVQAQVRLPSSDKEPPQASWAIAGVAARQALTTRGSIAKGTVDASLDVPVIDPASLRAAIAGSPLVDAGTLHVEGHGTLPDVTAKAHLGIGPGTVDVTAGARIGVMTTATVMLAAAGIDPASFGADTGHASLSASTNATIETSGGAISGRFDLQTMPAVLAGQRIPRATVEGKFTNVTVTGSARIEEEGAPADVDFQVHPRALDGSPPVVDFDARVVATDLRHVPRLAGLASGSAHARARGSFEIPRAILSARAEADVDHLSASHGALSVGSGRVDASVAGPIAALRIDGHVAGANLAVGGESFRTFDVRAAGGLQGGDVRASLQGEHAPDVELRAHVATGTATTVDGAEVVLAHKDVRLTAHVGKVRVGAGGIRVDAVTVDGVGAPVQARASLEGGSLAVTASGEDVDLARIGRLFDRENTIRAGHVAFAADVRASAGKEAGTVTLDLRGAHLGNVDDASGHVEAAIDDRHIRATVAATAAGIGTVHAATSDVILGGRLRDPGAFARAVGHVAVDADVDLAKLEAVLPAGVVPVQQASGRVRLAVRGGRDHETQRPDVQAHLSTHNLAFVVGTGASAYASKGTDAEVALEVQGGSQHTQLSVRIVDRKGTLVQLDATATPPLNRLVRGEMPTTDAIRNLPIHVDVLVPRRDLADLPAMADMTTLHGAVEAALHIEGTALAPRVELKARAFDLTGSNAPTPTRVNVDVLGTYRGDDGKVVVTVARPDRFVADLTATAKLPLAALLSQGLGAHWDANVDGHLTGLPLDALPGVASRRIHGDVSGDIALHGLHQTPRADVDLTIAGLRVAHTPYKSATISAHTQGEALRAVARIDQDDGFAEGRLQAALGWEDGLTPTLDAKHVVQATLSAKGVQIAAAQPFLEDTLSELEGRVDADVKFSYDAAKKAGHVQGSLALKDGLFEVPAAGGEFHAVRAKVTMDPNGAIRLEDLSASGASGRLTGSATAKLDGLALRDAEAKISIKRGDKLPLEVGGTPLGRVWGNLTATAKLSPDGNEIDAKVTVPQLYVTLPQSIGHSVQPMDANPYIHIGVHPEGAKALLAVPLEKPVRPSKPGSTRTHLVVALGNDVWVTRDTMLKIQLHDGPVVDVGDKTTVSGRVTAGPGTIELQSKRFELDHATVSFVGADPSNPEIVAAAHWEAPDKTRVMVDVSGRPEHLNISFHSEPDLPKDAILSLILFGDENGSFGSSQASPSGDNEDVNAAAGVAGGVVTQGVNKAISGVTSADITTRVDTSESQNPRPELAVQITKDVSATVAYNLGLPPPGQNPDRTQVILDYRFIRNWSLITTFGDAGSTIADLLWQYRY